MKEITKELIIKDAKIALACVAHAFSTFLGGGVIFVPIIQLGEINRNTILSMIFLLIIFGSLFGGYFGLIPLLRYVSILRNINQGNITVERDVLMDKEHINVSPDEDLKCILKFEKYSTRTGKGVVRTRKKYGKVKEGDEFYLVYVGKDPEPVLLYSVKEYFFSGTIN